MLPLRHRLVCLPTRCGELTTAEHSCAATAKRLGATEGRNKDKCGDLIKLTVTFTAIQGCIKLYTNHYFSVCFETVL